MTGPDEFSVRSASAAHDVPAAAEQRAVLAAQYRAKRAAEEAAREEASGGFDFWRDVVGDDIVFCGVLYSSSEWTHDSVDGIRRLTPAEQEDRRNQEFIEDLWQEMAALADRAEAADETTNSLPGSPTATGEPYRQVALQANRDYEAAFAQHAKAVAALDRLCEHFAADAADNADRYAAHEATEELFGEMIDAEDLVQERRAEENALPADDPGRDQARQAVERAERRHDEVVARYRKATTEEAVLEDQLRQKGQARAADRQAAIDTWDGTKSEIAERRRAARAAASGPPHDDVGLVTDDGDDPWALPHRSREVLNNQHLAQGPERQAGPAAYDHSYRLLPGPHHDRDASPRD